MNKNALYGKFIGDDSAESSVMQTITIAVSSILIMAGMIVVPNLVNNGRDDQLKTDLISITLAEDFRSSNTGDYSPDLSVLKANGGSHINLTSTTWTKLKLNNTNGYGVLGISKSGSVFVINGSLKKPVKVGAVKFNGEGPSKTVKAGSFVARVGDSKAASAAATFTNSGFSAADVYTAIKN